MYQVWTINSKVKVGHTSKGGCVKILWDYQVRTNKQVMLNYLDIVVLDKVEKILE